MKYFIDTEFLEGPQKRLFGHTKPTIDLISIGLVREDGFEYYAISKEFNVKEAWNRYDLKDDEKIYWIRENVLKAIFYDLVKMSREDGGQVSYEFTYSNFKKLLNMYGTTRKNIATDLKQLTSVLDESPEFYAYYADYDWVAFCWLFGRMIDLPKAFPMYCRDLKQIYDVENQKFVEKRKLKQAKFGDTTIHELRDVKSYPKSKNEHNAIADARWNAKLYQFLNYKG